MNEYELYHHGVKGQKWGVRRYDKSDTVFVSGKVKFDKKLRRGLRREVKKIIKSNANVVIGDAPGADKRVQDFLAKKKYDKVTVYTTDEHVRNNTGNWPVKIVGGKSKFNNPEEERAYRAKKDRAMTNVATKGLAITSNDDRPDSATAKNVDRLKKQGKPVAVYDYKKNKWLER